MGTSDVLRRRANVSYRHEGEDEGEAVGGGGGSRTTQNSSTPGAQCSGGVLRRGVDLISRATGQLHSGNKDVDGERDSGGRKSAVSRTESRAVAGVGVEVGC